MTGAGISSRMCVVKIPPPIKWTASSNKIVVYTGTLKNMQRYTGTAELFEKGILFGRGECLDGT
ncbi:MAG: hypothetical protein ACRDD9_08700, partial [Shewanella sp.]